LRSDSLDDFDSVAALCVPLDNKNIEIGFWIEKHRVIKNSYLLKKKDDSIFFDAFFVNR
jgi:hypothetical protein